jgi:hypothetical protein
MPATASGSALCSWRGSSAVLSAGFVFWQAHPPRLRERIVALVLLGGGSVVVLVAFAVSRLLPIRHARSHPGRHPRKGDVERDELNKVVRSLESAFGGLMLAAGTNTGHLSQSTAATPRQH